MKTIKIAHGYFIETLILTIALMPGVASAVESCGGLAPTIVGTEEGDLIFGTPHSDVIAGLGGADLIIGLMGDDTICGGDGKDIIVGGVGRDFVDGGDGDDVLHGSIGNDTIYGQEGQDRIAGGGGRDEIDGGAGDDTLFGGRDNDVMLGGEGTDVLFGDAGKDVLEGGRGDDNLYGGRGQDDLNGGFGDDMLSGGRGNDFCNGYIGIDSAAECETEQNIGLLVKQVEIPVPGGFTPVGGEFAGQTISHLAGALFVPRSAKKIAMIGTHGTFGRYYTSLTGWLGWWMEQNGITVLTLNRRDSADYGEYEGGGGTHFEDTLCDVGLGIDYLISLGYEKVIVEGHSKGTTVAPIYPVYYNNCPGKEGMTAANDPNVAGVITTGTMREVREAGIHAPWGSYYDQNLATANALIAGGLGDQLFEYFTAEIKFNPSLPPLIVVTGATPTGYLTYWDNPLRDVRITAKELVVPYMIIHTEGDLSTLREWSDALAQELWDNGNDVTYYKQPYTSLGYPSDPPNSFIGAWSHQITNANARDDATAMIKQWMIDRIPGSQAPATGIDMAAIEALPDFDPPLAPTPTDE